MLVAASDYVKALPDSIDRWLPRPLTALGTDGFGRSESRAGAARVLRGRLPLRRRRDAGGAGARRQDRRVGRRSRRSRRTTSIPRRAIPRHLVDEPPGHGHETLCPRVRGERSFVTDFTLPELGENIAAGDVLRVLVKPGDIDHERSAGPRARNRQGHDRSAVVGRRPGQGDQGQGRRQGQGRPGDPQRRRRRGAERRRSRSRRRPRQAAAAKPAAGARRQPAADTASEGRRRRAGLEQHVEGAKRRTPSKPRRRGRRRQRPRDRQKVVDISRGARAGAPNRPRRNCRPRRPRRRCAGWRASSASTSTRSRAAAPAAASRSTT